jgi:hypothetical protein
MTSGFAHELKTNSRMAEWAKIAISEIKESEPSMIIGDDVPERKYEDDGRTLIVPLKGPKCYACLNETGGATLMLKEEY